MTNKNISKNMKLEFEEIYNVNKVKFIFNLSFKDFDELFNVERDLETLQKYNLQDKKNYYKQINKFLNELLIKNTDTEYFINKTKYKVNGGRCYVKHFGVQKFQREIRDFLFYEEDMYDFDIVNCVPSILLYFADKYNINTPYLKMYIENRQMILNENGLTKTDVIINLYQDNPKTKNNFLQLLNIEFDKIKKFVNEDYKFKKYNSNDNSKNPFSSKLSKILYEIETDIIQKAIQHVENVNALTFDGFLAKTDCPIEVLDTINKSLEEYKYIKFIIKDFKPFDSILDNYETFIEEGATCNHYSVKKIEFEKRFNYSEGDGIYLEKIGDEWIERGIEQFKMNCANIRHTGMLDGKMKEMDTFTEWKKDPQRLTFDSIIFEPYNLYDPKQVEEYNNKYFNKKVINKFTGFKAKKLDTLTEEDLTLSKYFWDYLYETISYNNEEIFTHLKYFIAHIIHRPQDLPEVINVFKSLEGIGKDTLIEILSAIMGEKYIYSTEDQNEIFGSFNDVMDNKLIVVFNEAEGKSGNNNKEKIKGLSTKKNNTIKKKYVNSITQKNYIRIFFFSNNANPVVLSACSRRFCIINNNFIRKGDKEYFNDLRKNVFNPHTLNVIFTELLNMDLTNYQPRWNKPITNEEIKMKQHSYNLLQYYLYSIYDNLEKYDFIRHNVNFLIQPQKLLNNFIQYLNDEGYSNKVLKEWNNYKRITNDLLNSSLEGIDKKKIKIKGSVKTFYYFSYNKFKSKIQVLFKDHKIIETEDIMDDELLDILENNFNTPINTKMLIIDSDSDSD